MRLAYILDDTKSTLNMQELRNGSSTRRTHCRRCAGGSSGTFRPINPLRGRDPRPRTAWGRARPPSRSSFISKWPRSPPTYPDNGEVAAAARAIGAAVFASIKRVPFCPVGSSAPRHAAGHVPQILWDKTMSAFRRGAGIATGSRRAGFDPQPSLTPRGCDRRIQGLQCSTILAEDDCDRPSNQPRNVCAHIPNTYGRCRGLSSLRGGRLAAIARV